MITISTVNIRHHMQLQIFFFLVMRTIKIYSLENFKKSMLISYMLHIVKNNLKYKL